MNAIVFVHVEFNDSCSLSGRTLGVIFKIYLGDFSNFI